ncbi:hypothetical protein D3C73_828480 [compost metagenome]
MGQGLVGKAEYRLWRIAELERRQANVGHRCHIGGARRMQAGQGEVQVLGQLQRFGMHQPRRQHGKLTPANTRHQVQRLWIPGTLTGKLLADSL